MSEQVSWILELEVQEGAEDDLRRLATEMVKATKANEPGTLDYEWSIDADGRRCHIFERYADSAALLIHAAAFSEKYAARFLQLLKPMRFVVYGAPSTAAKDALADLQPVYMPPLCGFSR
jgi:quinol monooxygenase YgiN